jgi:pimeloyl-ACP methyl ester carboxylesterase
MTIKLTASAAALMLACASPAVADYLDPPPDHGAYWTAPAFQHYPPQGPQLARGIVLWSHGVHDTRAEYREPVPATLELFARNSYDVVRIQRDPRYENTWTNAGLNHVRDLVARAEKAKAEGYKLVIAAGQSYGGAIALEGSDRTSAIDGVLAMSPGYGSDALSGGSTYENQTAYLVEAVMKSRAQRIVLVFGAHDSLHPFQVRGPTLREALAERGKPFVLVDESAPGLPGGHTVGYTRQFTQLYGKCVDRFLVLRKVRSGETRCKISTTNNH